MNVFIDGGQWIRRLLSMADVCLCRRNVIGCPALIVFHGTKNHRSLGGGFFMRRDLAAGIGYKL